MSSVMIQQRPIVSIAAVTAAAAILIPAFYRYLTNNANKKLTYVSGFPVAPMSFWSQTKAGFKLGSTDFLLDLENLMDGAKDFWCYIMFRNTLRFSSMEQIKYLLMKPSADPTMLRQNWPDRWENLMGSNFLAFANEEAKRLRSILLKSMSKSVLTATYPLIKKSANEALTNLSELSSSGEPVEPLRHARLLFDDMLIWEKGVGDLFIPVWMNGPFAKGMKARKVIADGIQEMINERREMMRLEPEREFHDALHLFLVAKNDEGEGLTDVEIVDNVIGFVFAGYDTSASSISSVLHVLVNEISESDLTLLRNEITSSNPSSESEITSLPVLEAFTKEVLRLYSPIPATFRQAASDVVLPDGRIVPKGTTISLDVRSQGYNQELFPEPKKFDLGRFLVDEIDKKYPYAVLPFSAGPRMCVGYQLAKLEIKVFTCEAIQRFDVKKSDVPSTFISFPMYAASPRIFVSPKLEQ
ncbi:Cytochrome P450 4B1 [Blyttiomyces sp. JEL0837]|nr:Cytochrome P450 4B1 [Blyttiomyces sp. JEL0837]